MTDAATVGELDGEKHVWRLADASVVHLGPCPVMQRCVREPQRKRAAVLFDDTGVCDECRERRFREGGAAVVLPTQTEVPSDAE